MLKNSTYVMNFSIYLLQARPNKIRLPFQGLCIDCKPNPLHIHNFPGMNWDDTPLLFPLKIEN